MMKIKIAAAIFLFAGISVFAQTPLFYIGGRAGLGPLFGPDGVALGGNINPLQIDWQITPGLVLETGMGFYFGPNTKYTAPKQTDPGSGIMETYSGMEVHMVFPLLAKAVLRPNVFLIEIGAGVYAAPVLMGTMVERTNDNGYTTAEAYGKNLFSAGGSLFGIIATGSFGVKIGRGVLFLDLGYLRDFSDVTIKFNDTKIGNHLWNTLAINAGYKFGI